MKKKIAWSLAVMLTGGMLFAGGVAADGTGNADADLRIAEMKKLGANMGALSKFAKGEAEYSDALVGNAKEIASIADNLANLFPEGSGVEASRAKPEIWSADHKEAFAKEITTFQAAAKELVTAAETGSADAIGAALKQAGGSCASCHKEFRKPQS